MQRILIVEDDPQIRAFVASALTSSFQVAPCDTLRAAERSLEQQTPDVILLDVELPDGDGFRFCSMLRSRDEFRDVPVIFITSRAETEEKVMGLSLGADDYITKPFKLNELRARVDVQLRRARQQQDRKTVFRVGDLLLDANYQRVTVQLSNGVSTSADLTTHEFRLLQKLGSHEDQIFTREQLIDACWGPNVHVIDRAVDAHISNIRKKLVGSGMAIVAVHGAGYRLCRKAAAAGGKKQAG